MCPCIDLRLFMLNLCDLFFHFHLDFQFDGSYNLMNTNTCFFAYFLEYVLLFLGKNEDEERDKF